MNHNLKTLYGYKDEYKKMDKYDRKMLAEMIYPYISADYEINDTIWYHLSQEMRCKILWLVDEDLKRLMKSPIFTIEYYKSKSIKDVEEKNRLLAKHRRKNEEYRINIKNKYNNFRKQYSRMFELFGTYCRIMDDLRKYQLRPPSENDKGGYLYLEAKREFESLLNV